MYKENSALETPDNNQVLWRFMDFTKLVSILEKNKIFFPSSETLMKEDPFEGSYSTISFSEKSFGVPELQYMEEIKKILLQTNRQNEARVFINSWFASDYESVAMWKIYNNGQDGIAIKTTAQRLKDSFSEIEEDVYISKIKYIDYEKDAIDPQNLFYPYLHKRVSYEYEHEVRAIIPYFDDSRIDFEKTEHGIFVPIKTEKLIQEVVTSPQSGQWFYGLVQSIVDRYSLNEIAVKVSSLKQTRPHLQED